MLQKNIIYKIDNCKSSKQFNTILTAEEKLQIIEFTNFISTDFSRTRDLSYRIAHIVLNLNHTHICKVCKSVIPFRDYNSFIKQQYCSNACRYSDPHFYSGVRDAHANRQREIAAKREKTIMQKYGVANAMKLDSVKHQRSIAYNQLTESEKNSIISKRKATNISRYGSACSLNNHKHIETRIQNSGDRKIQQLKNIKFVDSYQGIIGRDGCVVKYQFKCCNCEDIFYFHFGSWNKAIKCPRCSDKTNTYEEFISSFLSKNSIFYEKNNRKILDGKEIDFYIPHHKIGIEINGLYYHSTKFINDKNYHLKKTDACAQQGIQLIHIFGDEILLHSKALKTRLRSIFKLNKIKLYARKCKIKEVDASTALKFLDKYHLQGGVRGAAIHLGVFYKDRLVQIASFGKCRKALGSRSTNCWELYRLSSMYDVTVVGGVGKLLKHFFSLHDTANLISYADRRWVHNNDNAYERFFKLSHTTLPNYWIVVGNKRHHRFSFSKQMMPLKLAVYDNELTEAVNLQTNNIFKIWDCGNFCYITDKKSI